MITAVPSLLFGHFAFFASYTLMFSPPKLQTSGNYYSPIAQITNNQTLATTGAGKYYDRKQISRYMMILNEPKMFLNLCYTRPDPNPVTLE
jgi:hypothetical protein